VVSILRAFPRQWRADAMVGASCAMLVALVCYEVTRALDVRWLDEARGDDVWFEGDLARIFGEMTNRHAAHWRATVHPLFSLFTVVPMYALRSVGCSPLVAMATIVASTAGGWTLTLYLLMRMLRLSRGEAVLFTAVGVTSAAGMFWLIVPESYALGSTTMLAALVLAGLAQGRDVRTGWFAVASAATLSVTVTNWVAGILATLSAYSWRRTAQITANAFVVVVLAWAVQRAVVPRADFFVGYNRNEQRYLFRPETGGSGPILRALFVHAIVMPQIATTQKPRRGTVLTVQRSAIGSTGIIGWIATACWAALLLAGGWGLLRSLRDSDRLPRTIALVLVAEVLLHLVYGTETFLYTLNVAPLLIAIAAVGIRTRKRWVLALACALVVSGTINNGLQWRRAQRFWSDASPVASRFQIFHGASPWLSNLRRASLSLGVSMHAQNPSCRYPRSCPRATRRRKTAPTRSSPGSM